jgi:hypothetical protein
MEKDLTKFLAEKSQDIEVGFPDRAQVAQVVVNGTPQALTAGPIRVAPPDTDKGIAKLDVTLDPARRPGPVEVQIKSGGRVFHHFILPGVDLARFRFAYEESEPNLVYCAVEDDYVVANKYGKCPIHG